MTEERKLKRMRVMSFVKVFERETESTIGRVLDMTTMSMKLRGPEKLEPSTVHQFKMTLPRTVADTKEVSFDGHVVWSREADRPKSFDTGIELVNVTAEHTDLIERFIQDTSFDDRWLSIGGAQPEEY